MLQYLDIIKYNMSIYNKISHQTDKNQFKPSVIFVFISNKIKLSRMLKKKKKSFLNSNI